jgi:drug/metabolite transporter (DMT)-like permease
MGMLLVLRPGVMPMTAGVSAAMVSAVFTAVSLITVRSLVGTEDSRAVAAWSFILITPPSLVLAAFVWTWPSPLGWAIVATIGGAAAIGQLSMTRAFQLAEASAVLPYDFVRFGMISVAGIVLFGERLDGWTLAGGAVILGSSIYIAVREAQLARSGKA